MSSKLQRLEEGLHRLGAVIDGGSLTTDHRAGAKARDDAAQNSLTVLRQHLDEIRAHKCERSELVLLRDNLRSLSSLVDEMRRSENRHCQRRRRSPNRDSRCGEACEEARRGNDGRHMHNGQSSRCGPVDHHDPSTSPGYLQQLAALSSRLSSVEMRCEGRASKLSVLRAVSHKVDQAAFSEAVADMTRRLSRIEATTCTTDGGGTPTRKGNAAFREIALRRLSLLEEEAERSREAVQALQGTDQQHNPIRLILSTSKDLTADSVPCFACYPHLCPGERQQATSCNVEELRTQLQQMQREACEFQETVVKRLAAVDTLSSRGEERLNTLEDWTKQFNDVKTQWELLDMRFTSEVADLRKQMECEVGSRDSSPKAFAARVHGLASGTLTSRAWFRLRSGERRKRCSATP